MWQTEQTPSAPAQCCAVRLQASLGAGRASTGIQRSTLHGLKGRNKPPMVKHRADSVYCCEAAVLLAFAPAYENIAPHRPRKDGWARRGKVKDVHGDGMRHGDAGCFDRTTTPGFQRQSGR